MLACPDSRLPGFDRMWNLLTTPVLSGKPGGLIGMRVARLWHMRAVQHHSWLASVLAIFFATGCAAPAQ
jgi:hypothetical protein